MHTLEKLIWNLSFSKNISELIKLSLIDFSKNCFIAFFSLALLMYIRPPEFNFMQTLIPNHMAWTEGIGGPKSKYISVVDKIAKSTDFLYALQKTLLLTLLTNNDGDEKTSSSRKLFLAKLRRYVLDLSMEQRVIILIRFK